MFQVLFFFQCQNYENKAMLCTVCCKQKTSPGVRKVDCSEITLICIAVLPIISCVSLGKVFSLSGPPNACL